MPLKGVSIYLGDGGYHHAGDPPPKPRERVTWLRRLTHPGDNASQERVCSRCIALLQHKHPAIQSIGALRQQSIDDVASQRTGEVSAAPMHSMSALPSRSTRRLPRREERCATAQAWAAAGV